MSTGSCESSPFCNFESFDYAIAHIFFHDEYFPENERTFKKELALARAVSVAAQAYAPRVQGIPEEDRWNRITKMLRLENLQFVSSGISHEHWPENPGDSDWPESLMSPYEDWSISMCLRGEWYERLHPEHIMSQLRGMQTGDILMFFVSHENTTIIFTKQESCTLCEAFEVSPNEAAESTPGPLICTYPQSAVQIPSEVFEGEDFQAKLANFFSRSRAVYHNAASSGVSMRYVNTLLAEILRGIVHIIDPPRITKRVRAVSRARGDPGVVWRRAPLWLPIKVAIQASLDRSADGRASYKRFMLHFLCTLARDGNNGSLSSDRLHSMACKILRRLDKLGPSIPDWLSQMALQTCSRLREIIDVRWKRLSVRSSPFRNPSQEELVRDTRYTLPNSDEYIREALADPNIIPPGTPFHPTSRPRPTLEDFLSLDGSIFQRVRDEDVDVICYDVAHSVEQGLDDWVASVTNVNDACAQLWTLIKRYTGYARSNHAMRDLTIIELFIALDKLVLKEIPILADYTPEIPIALLQRLTLRTSIGLHRLCRAYQYLAARHSRSRLGWSVLSDTFTENSFPVRFYDQSPYLQQLKSRIEKDAAHAGLQPNVDVGPLCSTDECQEHPRRRSVSRSPLPPSLSHAKAVVFELQCPPCIRIWRDAIVCVYPHNRSISNVPEDSKNLGHVPGLRPYLVEHPRLDCKFRLHYHRRRESEIVTLGYVFQRWHNGCAFASNASGFQIGREGLEKYLHSAWYTSNDILAAQADRPIYWSPDEFSTFGHLRSGFSLQWLNILHGLRSRSLNLCRREVYVLVHAAFEVGPLDLSTGAWVWHEELQDPSFCDTLLDELDSLFIDGASLVDGVLMSTISLLLTRLLASSPSEDILKRTISLLRSIRRKTFKWVQDSSYDVAVAPNNEERSRLLVDLAAVCRSTFDVDPSTLHKLFHSPEDVDALLSCTFFMRALRTENYGNVESKNYRVSHLVDIQYPQLLFGHDSHLNLTLEEILRAVVIDDPSDYGIDHAIPRIFASYQPGVRKWEPLQPPNARWVTSETKATGDRPPQAVSINLLDGEVLPRGAIISVAELKTMFPNRDSFGILSKALGVAPKYKVHFTQRGDKSVLRARCTQTNDVFEPIPSTILQQDLPPALASGRVYWLNLTTSTIEVRSLEQPWERSSETWFIACASGKYRVYRDRNTLVDIRSPTWAMISECFDCLEQIRQSASDERQNILVTTSIVDSVQSTSTALHKLSVALPRYGFSFFVNEMEELESHDFKDMVYDEDQCIGTLYGLKSLLVLRPKLHLAGTLIPEALIPKHILVPNGCLMPQLEDEYLRIDINSSRKAPDVPFYYSYVVDTELGCLIGDGSMSTSCLASLHAATDLRRPDPLTGKMGTQMAYHILHSAVHRSVTKLTSDVSYPPAGARLSKLHAPPWLTLEQLLSSRPAPELPPRCAFIHDGCRSDELLEDIPTLDQLFTCIRTISQSAFQQKYLALLEISAGMREKYKVLHRVEAKDCLVTLEKFYQECRLNFKEALDSLTASLGPLTDYERCVYQFGQWPLITPDILLQCLASTSPIHLPGQWKKCLISFALLLLELQRSRRLLRLALDGSEGEFREELDNKQCDGWNPEKFPDWLLIQIQGNFLIRRMQADTAMEMISPQCRQNTMMQVNMGEGKSSVIIPIVAAALADGDQLVRVVVPKTLIVQMFDTLVARLGRLANRPIYHLPFSRTKHDTYSRGISNLHELMSRCMAERGILLVQPEDVVSLRLTNVEEQMRPSKLLIESSTKRQKSVYDHVRGAMSLRLFPNNSLVGSIFRWPVDWLPSKKNDPTPEDLHDDQHGDPCSNVDNASKCLGLQKWLHSHVRDILDESDEILHPRFQLTYTIGNEQHVDAYPDRWTITQGVLRLAKVHLQTISRNHRGSIEYECGSPASFPRIHIVRVSDVGQRLISMIAQDIMDGKLPNFNFKRVSPELHDAIFSFISDEDILRIPDTAKKVEEYAASSHQNNLWNGLLLLRGLLTSSILLSALTERRWRVDYGFVSKLLPNTDHDNGGRLARSTPMQNSTMLAVPYRAKDVPAHNTHFDHPDLTIILTCLSYYYAGLSEEQLRISFEILLLQDDPSSEYALWIEDCDCQTLPGSLRKLGNIGIKSSEQWDKVIFPIFSKNQASINFYLSRVVFPKEAKEFPNKLSASSWDLAEKRERLITGFSGTNDGRWLLPMSVIQHDLNHQRGVNATVLEFLLQPENNFYTVTHENGRPQTTLEFLRLVSTWQPKIRVLLDVGAQILDLPNKELAVQWLNITQDAAAALYFNENDELVVLARNGFTRPLSSSPHSQQLGRCLVYLDHAHIRGTDVKLPLGSRAAVTLGPKVTKDSLVQGCMRMRKLGRGHSVVFFAPLGVDKIIRAVSGKNDPTTRVTTADVLHWAIHETWTEIEQQAPYWAKQGMDHNGRYRAWSRFCDGDLKREQLSDAWLRPDQRSLTDLYSPFVTKHADCDLSVLDPGIRQRCKDLGVLTLIGADMDEGQVREVNREREREREVELPPKINPVEHFLHPDIVSFVKTGVLSLPHSGGAFLPVFTTLEKSSAARCEADVWSPSILATADFSRTIDPESTKGTIDQYLRSVQWILSSEGDRDKVLVLLSPFEADRLMPDIRVSSHVHLHLYAPRTSKRMKPSDDLRLYSIPPLPSNWTPPWDLIDQLNVFAGQLYLSDYTSYLRVCHFLDVPATDSPSNRKIRRNLFNIPGGYEEMEITFSGSPLPFVMALLAVRTRGRPFAHTHMGKILQGQILTQKDFERPTATISNHSLTTHDGQTLREDPALSFSSWIKCDTRDNLGSSEFASLRPPKRGSKTPVLSEEHSQPLPRKRFRVEDK